MTLLCFSSCPKSTSPDWMEMQQTNVSSSCTRYSHMRGNTSSSLHHLSKKHGFDHQKSEVWSAALSASSTPAPNLTSWQAKEKKKSDGQCSDCKILPWIAAEMMELFTPDLKRGTWATRREATGQWRVFQHWGNIIEHLCFGTCYTPGEAPCEVAHVTLNVFPFGR